MAQELALALRLHFLIFLLGLLPAMAGAQSAKIAFPPNVSEVDFLRGSITDYPVPSAGQHVDGVDVLMVNGRLQVRPRFVAGPSGTATNSRANFDFDVGKLLHGTYAVDLLPPTGSTPLVTGSVSTVANDNLFTKDLSGHWWKPSEPGWGLMIWHRVKDNALFSAWFTYDAQSRPIWAVFQPATTDVSLPGLASQKTTREINPVTTVGPPMGSAYDSSQIRVASLPPGGVTGKLVNGDYGSFGGGLVFDPFSETTGLVVRSYPGPTSAGLARFKPASPAPTSVSPPVPTPPLGATALATKAGQPNFVDLSYEFNLPATTRTTQTYPSPAWSMSAANKKIQYRARTVDLPRPQISCAPLIPCGVNPSRTVRIDNSFQLGPLPAGTHGPAEFFLPGNSTDVPDYSTLIQVEPLINPTGMPWINFSDHWWNPQEPGTGMMMWHDVASGQAFAVYFGYDTNGQSYWFSLQGGTWVAESRGQSTVFRYSGTLYESHASGYLSSLYLTLPAKVIGSGSIEFTDASNGAFTYDITGVARKAMPITRFNP